MKIRTWMAVAAGLLAGMAQAAYVTVGNPGNAGEQSRLGYGDTTYYGGVAYEYQINQYETTAGEYAAFLNAVDPTGTNALGLYNSSMVSNSFGCQITWNSGSSAYDFSGAPSGTDADWENRPVNYVSWYDAARYTNWLTTGNTETGVYTFIGATTLDSIMDRQTAAATYGTAYFIPTEDEWYKAAYYDPTLNAGLGGYYDYPTGSDTLPTAETPAGGANSANYYDGGYAIGADYYRTEVGAYSSSASPYGTFDQGGNVWEWNETLIGGNRDRGVRGGSFGDRDYGLRADFRLNIDNGPTREDRNIGFRVASMTLIPEPGSLVLLTLAGLGMVARRRRVAC